MARTDNLMTPSQLQPVVQPPTTILLDSLTDHKRFLIDHNEWTGIKVQEIPIHNSCIAEVSSLRFTKYQFE